MPKLELVQSYASGDLVVLAVIERAARRGRRLAGPGLVAAGDPGLSPARARSWRLAHRHADPLVRDVGLKTAAALARGANLDLR